MPLCRMCVSARAFMGELMASLRRLFSFMLNARNTARAEALECESKALKIRQFVGYIRVLE